MFGRKQEPASSPAQQAIRVMTLRPAERRELASVRVHRLAEHLKAAGCAIFAGSPHSLNFHTGEHLLTLEVDPVDPRRIGLKMVFAQDGGDLVKARWACFEASARQFAAKASVDEHGSGYLVTLSVGVYAETLQAFQDSFKAYVDELIQLYRDFVELMMLEP